MKIGQSGRWHLELRRCGERLPECKRVWFYRWGLGVWLGRTIMTGGRDTRSRASATREKETTE